MCRYSVIVQRQRSYCLQADDFSCDHYFKHEAAGSSPVLSAKFFLREVSRPRIPAELKIPMRRDPLAERSLKNIT